MDNLRKLEQWLNEPCDEFETAIHPFGGGAYLPIDVINKKIVFAEKLFDAKFKFQNYRHEVYNLPASIVVSGSIEVKLLVRSDENFDTDSLEVEVDALVGSATFDIVHYHPNTHWGATCKSLCISNALLKYPQFGALLNSQRVEFSVKEEAAVNGKKKADHIIQKMMDNAQSAGDEKTIKELNEIYNFSNA